ncbi:hypothetical protein D3C72_2085780 [compost metagenome]
MQAMPATAPSAQVAQAPGAASPYAPAGQPAQPGMAPAPVDPMQAAAPAGAVDPASMSLAPDALGTRLGQRSAFLDGA